MTIGLGLVIFLCIVGIVTLIMQPVLATHTNNYMLRVRHISGAESAKLRDSRAAISRPPVVQTLCKRIGEWALKIFPKLGSAGIRQTLAEANYRKRDHLAIFVGAKVLCFGVCALIGAMQSGLLIILVVPLAFFGWVLPNFSVKGRAGKRKDQLFQELPTFLDLVAVCAQAGMGLLACLDRVCKEIGVTCPVVKEELEQLLSDVKVFARPLRTALQEMADRCGVDELNNLCAALIMSELKGSDISSTLGKQSDALRDRIKRKAEEQLATAPVKMVPVTTFFILPLIFVPTLGPPAMLLMSMLAQLTGAAHH